MKSTIKFILASLFITLFTMGANAAPNKPTITLTGVSPTQIDVTITEVADAVSYNVYRHTANITSANASYKIGNIANIGNGTVVYSDTEVAPGTRYYYTVTAVDAEDVLSAIATTLNIYTKLEVPVISSVVVNASSSTVRGSVTFTFETATNANRYYVEYSTLEDFSDMKSSNSSTTTLTISANNAPIPGTTFYYRAYAYHTTTAANTKSEYTAVGTFTTEKFLVVPAGLASTSVSPNQIDLSFNAVITGGVPDGYDIYRATNSTIAAAFSKIGSMVAAEGTAQSYSDTDPALVPGTRYYYRISPTAANASNSGTLLTTTSGLVGYTMFEAPTNLKVVGSTTAANSAIITWTGVASGTATPYYRLYRSTEENGTYTQVQASTALTCTNTLTANTTYYYKVASYGYSPAISENFSETIVSIIGSPTLNIERTGTGTQIDITVNPIAGAKGYKLYYFTSNIFASRQLIKSFSDSESLSYSHTGLSVTSAYYYWVVAVDENGDEHVYSNPYYVLARPTISTMTASSASSILSFTFSLGTVINSNRYVLERSTSESGTYEEIYNGTNTTYTDNNNGLGLEADTEYFYRQRVYNASSASPIPYSAYSAVKSGTTLSESLNPPTGLAVTPISGVTSAQMKITFNAVEGASSYKVYRATTETGTYSEISGSTTTEGTTVSFVTSTSTSHALNTIYYYKVTTLATGKGESDYSEVASGKTLLGAPSLSLAETTTTTQIDLTISNVTGATSYNLYVNSTNDFDTREFLALVGSERTYSHTGLIPGTTYYYWVAAVDTNGENIISSVNTFVSRCEAPVIALSSLASAPPTLKWDPVAGATRYYIYQATSETGTYTYKTYVTTSTYTATDLTAETPYWYKVSAYNNNALYSDDSNIVSFTTLKAASTTIPTDFTLTPQSPTQIDLSWNAVEGTGVKYNIYFLNPNTSIYEWLATVDGTSYSHTGLSSYTRCYYQIASFTDETQESAYSTANTYTLLDIPTFSLVVNSSSSITINWEGNNALYYYIERASLESGPYTQLYRAGSGLRTYNSAGLSPNTEYFYRMRASTGNNTGYTDYSEPQSAITSAIPAPEIIAEAASSTSNTITIITPVDGTTYYYYYYSITGDGTDWVQLGTTNSSVLTYTHTNLNPGTTYYYTVAAYVSSNYSPKSNMAPATTFVGAPKKIEAAIDPDCPVKKADVTLSYEAAPGADSYNIYRKGESDADFVKIIDEITLLTYTDTAISEGVYLYKIASVDSRGESAESAELTVRVFFHPERVYITETGNGSKDGSDWSNAISGDQLSQVLLDINNMPGCTNEIWVAAGTYEATTNIASESTDDRDKAFILPRGVKMYGGFAGTENLLSDRADIYVGENAPKSILTAGTKNVTTNPYHVVVGTDIPYYSAESSTERNTVLDGFVIRGGYASSSVNATINGRLINRMYGAGMYLYNASPILNRIVFEDNASYNTNVSLQSRGGALYVDGNSDQNRVYIANSIFKNNEITSRGSSTSSFQVRGGAIYLADDQKISMLNVAVHSNTGQAFNTYYSNGISIHGVGVYLSAGSELYMVNSIIAENKTVSSAYMYAPEKYSAIYNNEGAMELYNSIIWGEDSTTSSSQAFHNLYDENTLRKNTIIQSYGEDESSDADGNINTSVNPFIGGTDFRLSLGSAAVDAGNNIYFNNLNTIFGSYNKDLSGNDRIAGGVIDMGPYEGAFCGSEDVEYSGGIIYVNPLKSGNGESWDCAYSSLSDALEKANKLNVEAESQVVEYIYVAKGTYYPELFLDGVDTSDQRNKTFVLPAYGVTLVGGFPDDLSGRDGNNKERPYINETILSGDIDHATSLDTTDVDGNLINREGNSYHVLALVNALPYITYGLDGFVITGGNADGLNSNTNDVKNYAGGGFYAKNIPGDYSSLDLHLNNIIFRENRADLTIGKGGALYISEDIQTDFYTYYDDEDQTGNVIFENNHSSEGGAIYFNSSSCQVNRPAVFKNNHATIRGGAIFMETNSSIWNNNDSGVNFIDNSAGLEGGAIYISTEGSFHSSNVKFNRNSAMFGGAVYNLGNITPNITEFVSNEASIHGGALYVHYLIGNRYSNMTEDTYFIENIAKEGDGGAIYIKNDKHGTESFDKVSFLRNKATSGSGGAMYVVGSSEFDFSRITVQDNAAKNSGGGFHLESVEYLLKKGSVFAWNTLYSEPDSGNGVGAGIFNFNTNYTINNDADGSLVEVRFSENSSDGEGGAIANYGGTISNINWTVIEDNKAQYGAGLSNSHSDLTLKNSKVLRNQALGAADLGRGGAGLFIANSTPMIISSLFASNHAETVGGGAIFTVANEFESAVPNLVNVTLSRNSVRSDFPGGALYNKGQSVAPEIINTIIWDNTGNKSNPNIYNEDGALPVYSYSLIQGSNGSVSWHTGFGTDGGNNIDQDPQFINPNTYYFIITAASPASGRGDIDSYDSSTGFDATQDFDLSNKERTSDNNGQKTISMGAYESIFCAGQVNPTNGIVYVTETGSGIKDGSSWDNAYPGLAYPLKYAIDYPGCVIEVWAAKGTYYPQYKIGEYDVSNKSTTSQDKSFILPANVRVYGGFAGNENSVDSRVDIHGANRTILSGDVDYAETGDPSLKDDYAVVNADHTFGNTEGNAFHVVLAYGNIDEKTLLDGFVIQGGSANYYYNVFPCVDGKVDEFGECLDGYDDDYQENVELFDKWGGNSYYIKRRLGGGIYIGIDATPSLANLIVIDNFANDQGGGIYMEGNYYINESANVRAAIDDREYGEAVLQLKNIEVANNIANYGAGIYTYKKGYSMQHFDIHYNNAYAKSTGTGEIGSVAGGISANESYSNLLNGKITDNTAKNAGGVYISFQNNQNYKPQTLIKYQLTNVTLAGNQATDMLTGLLAHDFNLTGGLLIDDLTAGDECAVPQAPKGVINNSIILGNTHKDENGDNTIVADVYFGKYTDNGNIAEAYVPLTITNSLVRGSGGSGAWNEQKFGTDGGNNIDVDPQFVDPDGAVYSLLGSSPAIDTGNNSLYISAGGDLLSDLDLANAPRLFNHPQEEFRIIDMGAYEFQFVTADCPDPLFSWDGTNLALNPYADGIFVNSIYNGFGESWECAFHSFYDALDRAKELKDLTNDAFIPTIYVAKGTYYPEAFVIADKVTYTDSRNKSFVLVDGVKVYGGFADNLTGTTVNISDRSYMNETILTGDIDRRSNQDGIVNGKLTGREGNSYHVVIATGLTDANSSIDGFVITGANADEPDGFKYPNNNVNNVVVSNAQGGGLYANAATLTLKNITIKDNLADKAFGKGAGAYITDGTSTILSDNVVLNNNSAYQGGGLYAESIAVSGIEFLANSATYGGGAYLSQGTASVGSSTFTNNSATLLGGGLYLDEKALSADISEIKATQNIAAAGGGLYVHAPMEMKNSEIINNTATVYGGGGLFNYGLIQNGSSGELEPTEVILTSNIFSNNETLSGNGGAVYNQFGNLNFVGVTIEKNKATQGSGGGLYNLNGVVDMQDALATIDKNTSKYEGGGIAIIDLPSDTYTNTEKASLILSTEGTITNNTVTNGLGGGIFTYNANLKINPNEGGKTPVMITGNFADGEGGGIANYAGTSLNITWTHIRNNTTNGYGAGISNSNIDGSGTAVLKNMDISYNQAYNLVSKGAEIHLRGGSGMTNIQSSPLLVNVQLSVNSVGANSGAGMFNLMSSPRLLNTTIAGNVAASMDGSGIYNKNSSDPKVENSVISRNIGNVGADVFNHPAGTHPISGDAILISTPSYSHSLAVGAGVAGVDGYLDGSLNYADVTNPHFRNEITGDFRLKNDTTPFSPLIDAGSTATYDASSPIVAASDKDLDNKDRLEDDAIDIGAFESPSPEKAKVDITAFLEGAMLDSDGADGEKMSNYIQSPPEDIATGFNVEEGNKLPILNPYLPVTSYDSIRCESGPVGKVTDWIKVQVVRLEDVSPDAQTKKINMTVLEEKALLITPWGKIVDVDGQAPGFKAQTGDIHIVLRHRNHLSVVSQPVQLVSGNTLTYNFSDNLNKTIKFDDVYDPDQMKFLNGVYCLWGGDMNDDGSINNLDINIYSVEFQQLLQNDYIQSDINMQGLVDNLDSNIITSNFRTGQRSPICKYNQ